MNIRHIIEADMLALAFSTFMHFAADVAFGQDPFLTAFPQLNIHVLPPDASVRSVNPLIPDIKPDFAVGVSSKNTGSSDKQTSLSTVFDPTELSFLEWSTRLSEGGIPIVEYFAYDFMKRVKDSKEVRSAYQLNDFTAKTLSSIFYDIVLNGHKSVGSPYPEIPAKVAARAIAENFYKVKEDSLLRVITYNVAKHLFYRDVLTASNAVSFSKDYFGFTRRSIRSVTKPNPEANVRAIGAAVIGYISSIGLYTPYTANVLGELLADEWYSLRV